MEFSDHPLTKKARLQNAIKTPILLSPAAFDIVNMKKFRDCHDELFIPMRNFEHHYISSYGRITCLKYGFANYLMPSIDSKGYLYISIHVDSKTHYKQIHYLVASHFISNPDNKVEIYHIDGNLINNKVWNLMWR